MKKFTKEDLNPSQKEIFRLDQNKYTEDYITDNAKPKYFDAPIMGEDFFKEDSKKDDAEEEYEGGL